MLRPKDGVEIQREALARTVTRMRPVANREKIRLHLHLPRKTTPLQIGWAVAFDTYPFSIAHKGVTGPWDIVEAHNGILSDGTSVELLEDEPAERLQGNGENGYAGFKAGPVLRWRNPMGTRVREWISEEQVSAIKQIADEFVPDVLLDATLIADTGGGMLAASQAIRMQSALVQLVSHVNLSELLAKFGHFTLDEVIASGETMRKLRGVSEAELDSIAYAVAVKVGELIEESQRVRGHLNLGMNFGEFLSRDEG